MDEDDEDDEMDGEGYDDEDLDEMQAHGKLSRQSHSDGDYPHGGEYDDGEEGDCWPSFDRCAVKEPGHICQPPEARGELPRPGTPVGYDGVDDNDEAFA